MSADKHVPTLLCEIELPSEVEVGIGTSSARRSLTNGTEKELHDSFD